MNLISIYFNSLLVRQRVHTVGSSSFKSLRVGDERWPLSPRPASFTSPASAAEAESASPPPPNAWTRSHACEQEAARSREHRGAGRADHYAVTLLFNHSSGLVRNNESERNNSIKQVEKRTTSSACSFLNTRFCARPFFNRRACGFPEKELVHVEYRFLYLTDIGTSQGWAVRWARRIKRRWRGVKWSTETWEMTEKKRQERSNYCCSVRNS